MEKYAKTAPDCGIAAGGQVPLFEDISTTLAAAQDLAQAVNQMVAYYCGSVATPTLLDTTECTVSGLAAMLSSHAKVTRSDIADANASLERLRKALG